MNMQRNNNAIIVTSIIAVVILVIALVAISSFSNPTKDTMTVQGTSTLKVMPDMVSVHFNIQTNGTTSAEANDANSVIYNNLKAALIRDGFSADELGTENFNVYPNTYWDNGKQETNGFVASHMVKLEFSANETDKLSLVVDDGINAGAGVSYINFELSNSAQNTYKAQAIEAASKDAATKADAVAKGFGKSVGSLVSVSVDNYNYVPWVMYSASAGATSQEVKAAAADINPTSQDVTATVSATYKLA